MANTDKLLSVSFTRESIDHRTGAVIYEFEVKVTDFEWTAFDFGLSQSGEWVSGSRTFFELEIEIRDQALSTARNILSKMQKH